MSGLLCGYPMGAKTDSEFLDSRRISPAQARYLLAIANHPSPMFVLGYVADRLALVQGGSGCPLWAVALALYLPVIPVARLPLMRPALLGAVEITTGIQAIVASVPGFPAAVLIAAATAFGGFSGIFQTKSVLKNAGLSIRHYILWKALHSLITCILLLGLQSLLLICG